MSKLEDILTRMRDEPAFADAVFRDAVHALAEYHLPAEHVARFKAMSHAEFEALRAERQKAAQAIVPCAAGKSLVKPLNNRRKYETNT